MLTKLLGRREPAMVMPERIRREIEQEQDRSEMLIGWFQLGVVFIFGILYAVSPKPMTEFALEPFALGIYLLLTVIRLVWARRARLPAWSLFMSIVFDIALLMVLIWSFHIKYDQPAP